MSQRRNSHDVKRQARIRRFCVIRWLLIRAGANGDEALLASSYTSALPEGSLPLVHSSFSVSPSTGEAEEAIFQVQNEAGVRTRFVGCKRRSSAVFRESDVAANAESSLQWCRHCPQERG